MLYVDYGKMKNPALKGEVSINKMLKLTNPGLRRSDVVSNSFSGCIPDAAEELSRTPEVSFSKIVSKPGMFLQKFKGAISFEQLKSLANTHRDRHLNKEVDVINSDLKLINLKPFSVSYLPDEKLTIHPNPVELHGVFSIFTFPHKVESVLPEGMFSTFQIHFSSPEHSSNYVHHLISGGLESSPSSIQKIKFYKEGGNSSLGLKAEVSLPRM